MELSVVAIRMEYYYVAFWAKIQLYGNFKDNTYRLNSIAGRISVFDGKESWITPNANFLWTQLRRMSTVSFVKIYPANGHPY